MKNKRNNYSRKYKMQYGVQQIYNYTPSTTDYSQAYEERDKFIDKQKAFTGVANQFSGAYAPVGQLGGFAGDIIRNKVKNKEQAAMWGSGVEMGSSGAALGANIGQQIGGPYGLAIGAGVGAIGGGIYGATSAKKNYKKVKKMAQEEEQKTAQENLEKQREANYRTAFGNYSESLPINAQAALAKKGKYKLKTKQPRLIESEGREPVFGPKMKNGKRKLLFYNPDLPTHEEGGVPMLVVPKEMYINGTSNLMPKRSKVSLLGSGNMAVGAKQLKVNTLNDAALSSNLTGIPAVNAANKFVQPLAGTQQVARNISEDRRQEKINTPRSHKKSTGPVKTVNPPKLYEMKPPPPLSRPNEETIYEMKPPKPRSTFNTKNDFNKGSKKVKVYR